MKIDVEESKIYSYTDQPSDLYVCGMLHTGKSGYFSDNPDFADCVEGVLGGMNICEKYDGNYYPFRLKSEYSNDRFKYFCPEAYIVKKFEEPEFCPYKTLDELPFKIGDSVTFRKKGAKEQMMLICSGIIVNGPQLAIIHLGAYVYYPDTLFEKYEYFNSKEWVPFGVEE